MLLLLSWAAACLVMQRVGLIGRHAWPYVVAILSALFVMSALMILLYEAGRAYRLGPAITVPLAILGGAALCVLTGGVSSPILPLLAGASIPAIASFLSFRRSLQASLACSGLLAVEALLEYLELQPHIPVFADGSDPGTYRHPGYFIGLPVYFLGVVVTTAYGTGILAERLHRRETELGQAEQDRWAALGQLSAGIAGRLTGSLATIRNSASEAAGNTAPETRAAATRNIRAEVDRLDRLVVEYLRFARPRKVNLRPANLRDLIGPAVEILRNSSAATLSVETIHPLPALEVWADPESLSEALAHLLANAGESIGNDTGVVRIETRPGADDGVEISISDTGPPLTEEAASRAFDPLFTTKPGHAGLGLSIARRIAELHGGRLELDVRSGSKPAFVLRLRTVALRQPGTTTGRADQ